MVNVMKAKICIECEEKGKKNCALCDKKWSLPFQEIKRDE